MVDKFILLKIEKIGLMIFHFAQAQDMLGLQLHLEPSL